MLPHRNSLLTGWSLVRIRPGEPTKIRDLAATGAGGF